MKIRYRTTGTILRSALLSAVAVALAASASFAQVWIEQGDAGDLPATAQMTVGNGPLFNIQGTLNNAYDVDMYCIFVANEGAFIANLQCVVDMGPTPFLFSASGFGRETNFTCAGGAKQLTTTYVSSPGYYYLAVSYWGLMPVSGTQNIWNPFIPGLRAPDGPGAAGAVTGWLGTPTTGPINPYAFSLAGCEPCATPVATETGTWGKVKALYR